MAALAAFSVHLVADIVGGNWPVYLFYPISGFGMTIVDHVSNEVIYNAINPAVFLLGLLAMLLVGYRKEITPVEFFSQNLDQKIVSIVVYPFKYKCGICGKWAFVKCVVCEGKVCYRHIESLSQENKRFSGFFTFDRWRCSKCAKEGLSPD